MQSELIIVLIEGFLLGLALIIGLGPQNTFILQQSLKQKFVLLMALLASLIDGALIILGAGGAGMFFETSPGLLKFITWSGVIFLLLYGLRSFWSAIKGSGLELETSSFNKPLNRQNIIYSSFAVSLLNPATYLDTMIVIGSSANRYAYNLKLFFLFGAVLASIIWFFSLAFAAANLSKLLKSPRIQRVIDVYSGVIMWLIALRLLFHT
jgi:L-lysine exporter family protein LysE/ArgO